MSTGTTMVHTTDVVTIGGFALAILLAIVASTWNLRAFIASEIEDAMTATNTRLESTVANIRQEIHAGRESSDRQIAEIHRFISERNSDNDEDDDDVRH